MFFVSLSFFGSWSRPAWGAWIEIYLDQIVQYLANMVAPRMGRVD